METRKRSWYDHFSNLLGVEFSADSKDDNVKQIFQSVPIGDSLFPLDEFKAGKKNIKTSKEAGPDGISLEVLKYCDLDETVLAVCNQACYKPWQARPVVRKFP